MKTRWKVLIVVALAAAILLVAQQPVSQGPQASNAAPWAVNQTGNAAAYSGQQAVTGTAAALATNSVKHACVKALIANTIYVYLGPAGVTTATGFELTPGQAVCLPVQNTNLLYVVGSTTGASVSWIATN